MVLAADLDFLEATTSLLPLLGGIVSSIGTYCFWYLLQNKKSIILQPNYASIFYVKWTTVNISNLLCEICCWVHYNLEHSFFNNYLIVTDWLVLAVVLDFWGETTSSLTLLGGIVSAIGTCSFWYLLQNKKSIVLQPNS